MRKRNCTSGNNKRRPSTPKKQSRAHTCSLRLRGQLCMGQSQNMPQGHPFLLCWGRVICCIVEFVRAKLGSWLEESKDLLFMQHKGAAIHHPLSEMQNEKTNWYPLSKRLLPNWHEGRSSNALELGMHLHWAIKRELSWSYESVHPVPIYCLSLILLAM